MLDKNTWTKLKIKKIWNFENIETAIEHLLVNQILALNNPYVRILNRIGQLS